MVSGDPIIGNYTIESKEFILKDKTVTAFKINEINCIRVKSDKFLDEVNRNYFALPLFNNTSYLLIDYRKILKEPYIANNGYNSSELNKK